MNVVIHQTHHLIADFQTTSALLHERLAAEAAVKTLEIFPELYLSGYPLQDLVWQRDFITDWENCLKSLTQFSLSLGKSDQHALLFGAPEYCYEQNASAAAPPDSFPILPQKVFNSVYKVQPGHAPEVIYRKKALPNYDIFDEKKYYTPGSLSGLWQWGGKHFGLLICEDMWVSPDLEQNPCKELAEDCQKQNIGLHAVINFSASPFHLGKHDLRIQKATEVSQFFNAPLIYVNRVGGEDEILFDGNSFVIERDAPILALKQFEQDVLNYELKDSNLSGDKKKNEKLPTINSRPPEDFRRPRLSESSPITLKPLGQSNCQLVIEALVFGLREYARKNHQKHFLIGLSGGLDSAVVAYLATRAFGPDSVCPVYFPSRYSVSLSLEICEKLCSKLGLNLKNFPIKFLHSTLENQYQQNFGHTLQGLSAENIQARLRGMLLFALSNSTNALVLNTSNKSELAVGYSTLYGDSVGGISCLGDLYKTDIFELADFINSQEDSENLVFPTELITRAPSAELRANQTDDQGLPPYPVLDAILEGILNYRLGVKDLINGGLPEADVLKTMQLFQKSEYKRYQFCPIIKIAAKSFGFGHRMPLSKKTIGV